MNKKEATMATKVYGASDDLIEIEGDIRDEIGCYGTDDKDKGVLLIFSDGTILEVKYGKGGKAIWSVALVNSGELFGSLEQCADENADIYSDIASFKDGLKWAYVAKEWQLVN